MKPRRQNAPGHSLYAQTNGDGQAIILSLAGSLLSATAAIVATRRGYGTGGVFLAAGLMFSTNILYKNLLERTRLAALPLPKKTRVAGFASLATTAAFLFAAQGFARPPVAPMPIKPAAISTVVRPAARL